MARKLKPAKRANRPNPREERNRPTRHSRFDADNVVEFSRTEGRDGSFSSKGKRPELLPRNLSQELYLDTLNDETKSIVFAMGPAGTGKTMLATEFAISEFQKGNCKKIIITRPAVSVDEAHGFLPGTLIDKMAPWVIPIMDVFKEHYSVRVLERMIEEELIEIAPLAYMRGRTLKNAIIIADEMQNATPSQMKMLLTRIGENSRMIVTGDLRQHDRGFEANGLKDFVSRLKMTGSRHIAVCEFAAEDVERHVVIEDVLRIYGDE